MTFSTFGGVTESHTGRTPTADFTGQSWTPAVNDYVLFCVNNVTSGVSVVDPSGWTNLLGANTVLSSDSHSIAILGHFVTSGEATAGTLVYNATNFYNSAGNGIRTNAIVVRGSDPGAPVKAITTTFDSANANPHILPSVASASLVGGELLIRYTGADDAGSYTTPVTGHTLLVQNPGGGNGNAVFKRDTLSSAGVDVDAVNVTFANTGEYCSVSIAFTEYVLATTTNDTVGITDSATTAQEFNRSSTDTVGITDNATATQDFSRSLVDVVNATDTIIIIADYQQSIAETIGITDATTVLISGAAKSSTLIDDFASTLSTSKWFIDDAAAVSGQLQIQCTTGYGTLTSAETYDLQESFAFVELVDPPAQGVSEENETGLRVWNEDFSKYLTILLYNNTLLLREYDGSFDQTSIAYNPVDHRWLRIRESGGTIFFETSPNGQTWTIRRSKTPVDTYDTAYLQLYSGIWGSGTNDIATFDNFNTFPHSSSDSVGITDVLALSAGLNRTMNESVGITDSTMLILIGAIAPPDNDNTFAIRSEFTTATTKPEDTVVKIRSESTLRTLRPETNTLEAPQ